MKWSGWIWIGALGCLAVAVATQAATDNPYQKIVERNIFGLKPVPPPPPPPEPPPPPIPKITLQGITTILGSRQVLFKAVTPPGPGKPPKDQSYILSEGQREDDIEVLAIDENLGTVKFNNHSFTQTLDMKTDSAKATPGAAIPVATAKSPIPMPVFSQGSAGGDENSGLRKIPQRNVRTTPEEGSENAEPPPAAEVTPQVAAGPPEPALSHEEQDILIEVHRDQAKDDPDSPPYPPTEFTPPGTPGMPDPNNPADDPPSAAHK